MDHALHQQNIYNSQQLGLQKNNFITPIPTIWGKIMKTLKKHTKEMQRLVVRITNLSNYSRWILIIAIRNVEGENIKK